MLIKNRSNKKRLKEQLKKEETEMQDCIIFLEEEIERLKTQLKNQEE